MSSANGGRTSTMSDIVRGSRPDEGGDGTRTRVFIVRQPAHSVRPGDRPDPLPLRLAIGVIVGIGSIIAAWLIGTLGITLGFAPLLHLPALEVAIVDGLTATVAMAVSVPATIIRTGVEHPLLLMLGYALIALPAGCLAGVRVATPGGPRPHVLSQMFSYTVVVLCIVQACALVWWVAGPFRAGLIESMPPVAGDVAGWFTSLRSAAGLDLLAAIIATLWVVLIMRVAIPQWLRALCAPVAFFVLVLTVIAMAMTNTTVAELQTPRTIVAGDDGASSRLMLGRAGGQAAMMSRAGDQIVIELESPALAERITDRQSIIEFIGSN